MIDASKYYLFYDGDCGFCNHWVQWILKNDHRNQFLFAALQSDFGQNFLKERGLETHEFNTLYLWKPNHFYLKKSQAIIKIAEILGGKYKLLANLNFLARFLSDIIYDQIAKNRLKLAPQNCLLPTQEERKKFLN